MTDLQALLDAHQSPFTGHVTSFKLARTDGGVAFYEAVPMPWLAYLRLRRNNRLFHAQSLHEQAQAIFADYGGLPACDWKSAPNSRSSRWPRNGTRPITITCAGAGKQPATAIGTSIPTRVTC